MPRQEGRALRAQGASVAVKEKKITDNTPACASLAWPFPLASVSLQAPSWMSVSAGPRAGPAFCRDLGYTATSTPLCCPSSTSEQPHQIATGFYLKARLLKAERNIQAVDQGHSLSPIPSDGQAEPDIHGARSQRDRKQKWSLFGGPSWPLPG